MFHHASDSRFAQITMEIRRRQTTDTILMVRPSKFRANEQTAVNNYYQDQTAYDSEMVTAKALQEFDTFVSTLRREGIEVIVHQDTNDGQTPDSVFPNNWISFHENGDIVVYPMFAKNRRNERKQEVIDEVEGHGFTISQVMDYTAAEEEKLFLEGTGSMVLDRENGKAYCALSPRADESLFIEFCEDYEYTPVVFTAYQTVESQRLPIYHTNVMMAIGDKVAVICLDCIDNKKEKKTVRSQLKESGKEIVNLTENQLYAFAGNMLEVRNEKGEPYMVMSTSAYESLTEIQITQIEKHTKIVHSNLETIERLGGGSARCMMAEIFLPKE